MFFPTDERRQTDEKSFAATFLKIVSPKLYFYYKFLPKKRMSVSALIFNARGELLILKPGYRPEWILPGGSVDKNESPEKACSREIQEEIALAIPKLKFICVNYTPYEKVKGDSLQFMFYGGILKESDENLIKIDRKEIIEYKFSKIEDALPFLTTGLQKRIPAALEFLKNKTSGYLENT